MPECNEETTIWKDVLTGDAAEKIVVFLPLRDVLRLEYTARGIVTRSVWASLASTFEASVAGNNNADNPEPSQDDIHPKIKYLNLALNQKTSTAGKDMFILHFQPNGPYWHLIEGGDFGVCAHLRTVCWGEWWAYRELPASNYDIVIRMKWGGKDFDRVRSMHFDCNIDGTDEPLLSVDLSDDIKEGFRRNGDSWINLNIGFISLASRSKVCVNYLGVNNAWYFNWTVDWIGFFPSKTGRIVLSWLSLSTPSDKLLANEEIAQRAGICSTADVDSKRMQLALLVN
ncbi:hypothetical protein LEN26_016317 [Aphanomyces euteiches]|nr:hypothetical protein LEN26_016317 [Aphanomyces euteiches]